jgi:methyltransferase (TIGR00027 family)
MNETEPLIRNISDTARWVAVYRAQESERPDALFRDPLARRLAGERGVQIVDSLPDKDRHAWAFVTRTVLFDRFILEQVRQGADMVINLAAGLDARPYRMPLPPTLQWIEVDLPELLTYKEEVLAGETPVCALERVRMDLADGSARRDLFAELSRRAKRALAATEGLLVYLAPEEVGSLARDLAAPDSIQSWVTDLTSPGLMRMIQRQIGPHLSRAQAPFKFAPEEGPEFFSRYGWRPRDVCSTFQTAARLKRIPFLLRLLAMIPESKGRQGSRPWSGTCLLEKALPGDVRP